jgi:hypothetical protein
MKKQLCFPAKVLDQHLVALGKTGAGKSSALRHIVEYLLLQKKRVCVIDPKGDWWGLKSSVDGNGPGFPVIAFGDFKKPEAADIPLNAQSGKHIAELITSGNRPCVIGMRGWSQGAMTRFWIDFASTLFARNAGELYLVGDEFHNFAPKQWKGMADKETPVGQALHWSNRLLSEGRGLGLVCLIASQRPQKVHNDTLTSCETLIAMRVTHSADRQAVASWIEGCGDKAQGTEVLNNLAQLPRGEAYVWSPEIGFGPSRTKFPMFQTFDSFAPPQLQKKVSQKGWSSVNLDDVKTKLSKVIDEAKAHDPKELQRRIIDLEKQLRAKQPASVVAHKPVDVRPIIEKAVKLALSTREKDDKEIGKKLQKAFGELIRWKNDTDKTIQSVINGINCFNPLLEGIGVNGGDLLKIEELKANTNTTTTTRHEKPQSGTVRVPMAQGDTRTVTNEGNGQIGKGGLYKILVALAQAGRVLTYAQVGARAGVSSNSGSFKNWLSQARVNGWITGSGSIAITDKGLEDLGEYAPLPSGEELHAYWINKVGGTAGRILRLAIDHHPNYLSYEDIGSALNVSHTSGSFKNWLSSLRVRELIEGKGQVKAADTLFE